MSTLRHEIRSTWENGGSLGRSSPATRKGGAHCVPQAVVVAFAGEKPAQPLLAHIRFDRGREPSLARGGKRAGIEVRAEHLHRRLDLMACRLLEQQNSEGKGFLSGRAAG